ncbi:hypothetical protein BT96DRAFT_542820 [Gymnopus androsaceus JB14]|uniref:Protein kinase domain-containing protein n=1 Tax=Gymnopus androsaceus JB14 TaxID=1447944 RepID=A0A6A4HVT9_9AGAR|nr:hypothetical protein BT96DRAFT_542820 [Gymnopus androsaceus JB14]
MEHPPDVLSFFSSVTLCGLANSSSSSESYSEPLTLVRNQSFPAKRYIWCRDECTTETDSEWDSLPFSIGKAHADFELLEWLGEGRISITYAARLICLRQSPGGETLPLSSLLCILPDEFCVKLAKVEFIRSLAREAWFYEQIAKTEGCQGIITPLCFGFFTTSLPSTLQIRAWSEIKCVPHKDDDELVYDRFYDDKAYSRAFADDQQTCRDKCPWTLDRWIARTDRSPIVGILITERLGEHFPSGSGINKLSKESEAEILDILDDLSSAGVLHGDVKFNNFLCPASSSSPPSCSFSSSSFGAICPRHSRIHAWRVIDFDRAVKWGKSIPRDVEYFTDVQRVDFECGFFWGGDWRS